MFAISVIFTIQPQFRGAFLEASQQHAANSRTEKDCVAFEIWEDPENPNCFYFHEVYASKAAVDEVHAKMPYYAEFREKVTPWVLSWELRVWQDARA